ncbi:Hypothetical_protein [Hexamita inflata]|uniref:Hypothetical_protein n=1 Tax=Hexamita inflata TaxID=28002 RepID=A0AA86V7J5_9EUKA|nr:Hypothetical protein HINF_LOCUS46173 [Hexamita inflata]
MTNTVVYFALNNVKEHNVQNFLRKEYQNKILQANGEKILELERIRTRNSTFPKIEEGLKQFFEATFEYCLQVPCSKKTSLVLNRARQKGKNSKAKSLVVLGARKESYFDDKTECYHPQIRENSVDSFKHNIRTIKIVCVV